MSKVYRDEQDKIKEQKIQELAAKLPGYIDLFISSSKRKRSPQTILTYMQRISFFFDYLSANPKSPLYKKDTECITAEDLDQLKVDDIDLFLGEVGDSKNTINNYISALNALFSFLYRKDRITHNVIDKVERAAIRRSEHIVIRLNDEQEIGFIDSVTDGSGLTKKQMAEFKKNSFRDRAICLMLIRTGLRVSELVSLDVRDVDITKNTISVIRKRSKPDVVFFDDEVKTALLEYLDTRPPLASSDVTRPDPLFLSNYGKTKGERITVKQVEHLVKKYTSAGAKGTGKGLSPHKLRATFATNMLQETENVFLVQEHLAHENIQTTTLYLGKDSINKKAARNILMERDNKLREERKEKDEHE